MEKGKELQKGEGRGKVGREGKGEREGEGRRWGRVERASSFFATRRRPWCEGREAWEGKGRKIRIGRGKEGTIGGTGKRRGDGKGKGRREKGARTGLVCATHLPVYRQYSGCREASFELLNVTICLHGSKLSCSYDKEVITRRFPYRHLYQALGRHQPSTSSRADVDARALYLGADMKTAVW